MNKFEGTASEVNAEYAKTTEREATQLEIVNNVLGERVLSMQELSKRLRVLVDRLEGEAKNADGCTTDHRRDYGIHAADGSLLAQIDGCLWSLYEFDDDAHAAVAALERMI